jgi:hypothetical protein
MKRILPLLMALGLFVTACDNNKTAKNQNTNNREKDDYGKPDNRNTDNSNKDDFNQKNSWSGSDISSFNAQCLTAFKNDEKVTKAIKNSEEVAKAICPCLLEKFQSTYVSLAEMDIKSSEAEGRKMAGQCRNELGIYSDENKNLAGGWPLVEQISFKTNCVKKAMAGGRSRIAAQNYCDCMLNNMENLYPDIQDAAGLTEKDLETPAMKQMIKKCLGNN